MSSLSKGMGMGEDGKDSWLRNALIELIKKTLLSDRFNLASCLITL